jgi:peptide chain release factor 1
MVLQVEGKGAKKAFAQEGGGQRHQRVPPTEKRGRVQTSTCTVAVLPVPTETEIYVDPRDLEWSMMRGSGAGGQARNKTSSAVLLKHLPSGLAVRCESERSQLQNKETALSILRARLLESATHAETEGRNKARRGQLGSGMRGDKARTYRHQDDVVTDHTTGKKAQLSRVLRGFLEDLF